MFRATREPVHRTDEHAHANFRPHGDARENDMRGVDTESTFEERTTMRLVILILLLLLILGALPTWPYSAGWGYYPSGLGLLILIVLAVVLLRRA